MSARLFLAFVPTLLALGACDPCPANDCSACPTPAVDCSTCAPAPASTVYDPTWDNDATALLADVSTAPPGSGVGAPQVLDGELSLKDVVTAQQIGLIFAQKTDLNDPLYSEQWILTNYTPTSFNVPFAIVAVGTGTLTTARMNQLRTDEGTNNTDYKLSSQLAEYRVLPASGTLTALNPGMPPGTQNVSFKISSITGVTVPDTGWLYREVRDNNGTQVWTDHWVFSDKYQMVGGAVSARVDLQTPAYADLKAFMADMDTRRNASSNAAAWRYQQVRYIWRDL